MTRYAEGTTVPVDRSRAEIERILMRYGADQFAYGYETGGDAMIQFRAHERLVRLVVPFPDRAAREYTHSATGLRRSEGSAQSAWEAACRQRWRALVLVLKAKLEAVESGISAFEDEFLAQTVLPDNTTVANYMRPQLDRAYERGLMPLAFPALEAGS